MFTLRERVKKKSLALTCRVRIYTCDDLFTRTRVLIRFKTLYTTIYRLYVCVCVCVCICVFDNNAGEAKRAQTAGNKKKRKKKKMGKE